PAMDEIFEARTVEFGRVRTRDGSPIGRRLRSGAVSHVDHAAIVPRTVERNEVASGIDRFVHPGDIGREVAECEPGDETHDGEHERESEYDRYHPPDRTDEPAQHLSEIRRPDA